ncbi:MAG TPA: SDR family oxidoreductase [Acetobacteraceae bacterium]|nr:SDR family oxidoreductase [Acetobacteraceae bacterium]
MRVLITGNLGYVGSALAAHLRAVLPATELLGYDAGFFAHCITAGGPAPETGLASQYFGDVRDLPASLLTGVDAIVHLAAISNDPMGNRFEAVTEEINTGASLRLAALAAQAGVRSFVFASSCSIYGRADASSRRESDSTCPLTAYARSKVATEQSLKGMNLDNMAVTCLRFATACGMSSRLRLDLVLNDFAASALATGEIVVLSDGTPWRPLIEVSDMGRAIEWAINRDPRDGGRCLMVNVGSDAWNFQVKDLANAVAASLPGTRVSINEAAPPDNRSYRVDFSLFRELAPRHQPQSGLEQTIARLVAGLRGMDFRDGDFRNSSLMRLKVLERLIDEGHLSASLRWRLPPVQDLAA